ncbi:hypothetical protein C8R45DRAFT_943366 [Mycena sanguinolenta]|nr:hypothetical protein C8R45DRAFT_943366 [Mycena sanguinolenta]
MAPAVEKRPANTKSHQKPRARVLSVSPSSSPAPQARPSRPIPKPKTSQSESRAKDPVIELSDPEDAVPPSVPAPQEELAATVILNSKRYSTVDFEGFYLDPFVFLRTSAFEEALPFLINPSLVETENADDVRSVFDAVLPQLACLILASTPFLLLTAFKDRQFKYYRGREMPPGLADLIFYFREPFKRLFRAFPEMRSTYNHLRPELNFQFPGRRQCWKLLGKSSMPTKRPASSPPADTPTVKRPRRPTAASPDPVVVDAPIPGRSAAAKTKPKAGLTQGASTSVPTRSQPPRGHQNQSRRAPLPRSSSSIRSTSPPAQVPLPSSSSRTKTRAEPVIELTKMDTEVRFNPEDDGEGEPEIDEPDAKPIPPKKKAKAKKGKGSTTPRKAPTDPEHPQGTYSVDIAGQPDLDEQGMVTYPPRYAGGFNLSWERFPRNMSEVTRDVPADDLRRFDNRVCTLNNPSAQAVNDSTEDAPIGMPWFPGSGKVYNMFPKEPAPSRNCLHDLYHRFIRLGKISDVIIKEINIKLLENASPFPYFFPGLSCAECISFHRFCEFRGFGQQCTSCETNHLKGCSFRASDDRLEDLRTEFGPWMATGSQATWERLGDVRLAYKRTRRALKEAVLCAQEYEDKLERLTAHAADVIQLFGTEAFEERFSSDQELPDGFPVRTMLDNLVASHTAIQDRHIQLHSKEHVESFVDRPLDRSFKRASSSRGEVIFHHSTVFGPLGLIRPTQKSQNNNLDNDDGNNGTTGDDMVVDPIPSNDLPIGASPMRTPTTVEKAGAEEADLDANGEDDLSLPMDRDANNDLSDPEGGQRNAGAFLARVPRIKSLNFLSFVSSFTMPIRNEHEEYTLYMLEDNLVRRVFLSSIFLGMIVSPSLLQSAPPVSERGASALSALGAGVVFTANAASMDLGFSSTLTLGRISGPPLAPKCALRSPAFGFHKYSYAELQPFVPRVFEILCRWHFNRMRRQYQESISEMTAIPILSQIGIQWIQEEMSSSMGAVLLATPVPYNHRTLFNPFVFLLHVYGTFPCGELLSPRFAELVALFISLRPNRECNHCAAAGTGCTFDCWSGNCRECELGMKAGCTFTLLEEWNKFIDAHDAGTMEYLRNHIDYAREVSFEHRKSLYPLVPIYFRRCVEISINKTLFAYRNLLMNINLDHSCKIRDLAEEIGVSSSLMEVLEEAVRHRVEEAVSDSDGEDEVLSQMLAPRNHSVPEAEDPSYV